MKIVKNILLLSSVVLLSSCFQAYSEDDELCTIPTTNNPQIVPSHGSSMIPGMSMPH